MQGIVTLSNGHWCSLTNCVEMSDVVLLAAVRQGCHEEVKFERHQG